MIIRAGFPMKVFLYLTAAPAKIVRAPPKITGLIMFHMGFQIKILVLLGIFDIKKSKKTKWQPCIHAYFR